LNGLDPACLRLREIKRDYMFGVIWRDNKRSVKSVTVNTNKIVYQVLTEPEALKDEQIVVILKKRNPEKRIYE
jgi:ubiquitin carboxyl-terminal hydrolase 40